MLELSADDPLIQQLDFRLYRYTAKRRAKQFLPGSDQPQTVEVETSWGGVLTGKRGDYLVSEYDEPDEQWVVTKDIFETTYQEIEAGIYRKKATVELAPLTQITHDPDQEIIIHSQEGPLTVRAGDFYLARGDKGEIWPRPKENFESGLEPVE